MIYGLPKYSIISLWVAMRRNVKNIPKFCVCLEFCCLLCYWYLTHIFLVLNSKYPRKYLSFGFTIGMFHYAIKFPVVQKKYLRSAFAWSIQQRQQTRLTLTHYTISTKRKFIQMQIVCAHRAVLKRWKCL